MSQVVKVNGKPMEVVSLSAKTGKVKVVALKVMGGADFIMIEGTDKDGLYRKFKMGTKDVTKYAVEQEVKIVHPKLGLFYGTVCYEQIGEPTWIEPNSIK